jgi:hypothetical protein
MPWALASVPAKAGWAWAVNATMGSASTGGHRYADRRRGVVAVEMRHHAGLIQHEVVVVGRRGAEQAGAPSTPPPTSSRHVDAQADLRAAVRRRPGG